MRCAFELKNMKSTFAVYGLLPCALGLGTARYVRWTDAVWLTTAGSFWPIVLSSISGAILIKLMFSPFQDKTGGLAAWLTLVLTWFYVPLWAAARELPYAAAVVGEDGRVHIVSEVTRDPALKVWFLTDHRGARIVHNVVGKVTTSELELEYRYAEPYIATRREGEDLSTPVMRAASSILQVEAALPRASRIALMEKRALQDRVLERICRAAVGAQLACPIKMSLSPQIEATALGATWSAYYTETEAIAEKHLPSLIKMLTKTEAPLAHRREAFALLLELAVDATPMSEVAQHSHLLDEDQFDELIRRLLASPGCGNEAVAIISKVNRLSSEQRSALRAKALSEAGIATLLAQAVPLRITDSDIGQIATRMPTAFVSDPGVAVRALEVFGERLPPDIQRDAVTAIVASKPSYALAALRHVNFSTELRRDLMQKVLSDASQDDFSSAGLSKEELQGMLTPTEMQALIGLAINRSETSGSWLDFVQRSLPISAMTPAQQNSLVTELLFKSPKAALEFVSENHRYLEPAEVNEVTRDYARTITADLCLHLSHRNRLRKMAYFSEAQLEIFRNCADPK